MAFAKSLDFFCKLGVRHRVSMIEVNSVSDTEFTSFFYFPHTTFTGSP